MAKTEHTENSWNDILKKFSSYNFVLTKLNMLHNLFTHHCSIQTHNLQHRIFRDSYRRQNPSEERIMRVCLMGRERWE
jgi:hypothetical protein